MAKSKTKVTSAADKRKQADADLEARIANRKKAAAVAGTAKPDVVAPLGLTVAANEPVAESVAATTAVAKPKKERKARTPKEAVAPSEALTTMLDKVRAKAVKEVEKKHKAEIKQLKTDHAHEVKQMVDTDYHEAELKKAYAAGLKDGEKKAYADIKAALKQPKKGE